MNKFKLNRRSNKAEHYIQVYIDGTDEKRFWMYNCRINNNRYVENIYSTKNKVRTIYYIGRIEY